MSERFAFIINPTSGSARKWFPGMLGERFPGSKITYTRCHGHAVELAREAAAEGRIPVACGGDGTFRDVAFGTGGKVPFGFVPLGTVNLLGLALGIPNDIKKALAILEAGRTKPIYPGHYETDRGETGNFFIGISAGPDADAIHDVNLGLKKLIGRYAYVLSLARRLLWPVREEIECETDGEKARLGVLIALRMTFYGGPFHMGNKASVFEREIEVIGVCGGRWRLLRLYASVLTHGLLPQPKILRKMAHKVVVGSATGRFQVDGDNLHASEVTLTSAPAPLEVIC